MLGDVGSNGAPGEDRDRRIEGRVKSGAARGPEGVGENDGGWGKMRAQARMRENEGMRGKEKKFFFWYKTISDSIFYH